jgi:pyruvate/2-oxoglutarate dehydrogenase complex dihydrolipoamide acyltransferase (E2) component
VSDDITAVEGLEEPRGDTRTSLATSVIDPDGSATSGYGSTGEVHPLSFGEMSPWQVQEYMKSDAFDAQAVVDAIEGAPDQASKEALANKFLTAAAELEDESLETLVTSLSTQLGVAPHGPGPDDDGVELPGAESREDTGGSEGGDGGQGDGASSDDSPFASPEAEQAAKDAGLTADDIEGTGADGKIKKSDVEKAAASK